MVLNEALKESVKQRETPLSSLVRYTPLKMYNYYSLNHSEYAMNIIDSIRENQCSSASLTRSALFDLNK